MPELAAESQPSKRRGDRACRRCRRLRSKCMHDKQPPCVGCQRAGPAVAAICSFPRRGEQDVDRLYRAKNFKTPDAIVVRQSDLCEDFEHRRTHPAELSRAAATCYHGPAILQVSGTGLPPHSELIEGCRVFTSSYFQLGFIPKTLFLESLCRNVEATSSFLLAAILTISARFTPPLVARHAGVLAVTSHFIDMSVAMVPSEMYKVDLEHVQAFFLLSIAEWGNGDKDRSIIHKGIAVRMATILRLHREDTYNLPADATGEAIVDAEIGRRTFWMLQSQDNLHSGPSTPVAFSPADITALLPCDENEFAFGLLPPCRASLPGTAAAMRDPRSVAPPQRSLFATLIQAHNYWGIVARRAGKTGDETAPPTARPEEATSSYRQLAKELHTWEQGLPDQHKWSVWNLRGYKAEGMELAYLATVMVIRLANIVLRRIYLDDLLAVLGSDSAVRSADDASFWQNMSQELFDNMLELHNQIEAYFTSRLKADGYPAILAFCVYTCGSVAAHLWKWPKLCPNLAPKAPNIAAHSLSVLSELQHAWPTASRWRSGLQQVASPVSVKSSCEKEANELPQSQRARHVDSAESSAEGNALKSQVPLGQQWQGSIDHGPHPSASGPMLGIHDHQDVGFDAIGSFEAELAALLHGDTCASYIGGWELSNSF